MANIKAEISSLREERENPMVELQHHKTENKEKVEVARLMYHMSLRFAISTNIYQNIYIKT